MGLPAFRYLGRYGLPVFLVFAVAVVAVVILKLLLLRAIDQRCERRIGVAEVKLLYQRRLWLW